MTGGNFLLNYDCWWKILQYLEIRDQIRLRQSGSPIRAIIDEYWQRNFSTLEVHGGDKFPDIQEFHVLIASICATVEELKLYCLLREHFNVLLLHTYPRTVDFRFTPQAFGFNTYPGALLLDSDVVRLSKVFPNLRTLHLSGPLTGRDFWLFRHLNHLTVTNPCPRVQIDNIVRLLREVPVKSIQFEAVPSSYSRLVASDFLALFRLEEFTTNNTDWFEMTKYWLEYAVDGMRARPDTGYSAMQERKDRWHEFRADQFFANLKCLTVTEWELHFEYFVPNLQRVIAVEMRKYFPEHLGQLENLQEICLYYCSIESEWQIWSLLRNSTRLERLSIEKCRMGFPVLHVSDDNLATGRSTPLTLNFFGNYKRRLDGNPVTVVNDCTRSRCNVTSIKTVRRHCLPAEKWVRFYYE